MSRLEGSERKAKICADQIPEETRDVFILGHEGLLSAPLQSQNEQSAQMLAQVDIKPGEQAETAAGYEVLENDNGPKVDQPTRDEGLLVGIQKDEPKPLGPARPIDTPPQSPIAIEADLDVNKKDTDSILETSDSTTSAEHSATDSFSPTHDESSATTISTTENTRSHLSNVDESFKEFAKHEKLRAREEASKKRSLGKENTIKLKDLKNFAAYFKLRS